MTLLYTYKFLGMQEDIVIQAPNRYTARRILTQALYSLPDYANKRIVGETVESPVSGVTTIQKNGKTYLWVGKQKTTSGWELKAD
jgi:hypothetical protein